MMASCNVERVSRSKVGRREAASHICGQTPARPFTAYCACGDKITGYMCEACSVCKLPGCLTCWRDGAGHVCPVEFSPGPADRCARGHLRDGNTSPRADGARECRDCRTLRERARRRGITPDALFILEAAGTTAPIVRLAPPVLPECWACGRQDQPRGSRGLCVRCYTRWQGRGFAGPGPGLEWASQAQRASDHMRLITTLSARDAAAQIGNSPRTVTRWRKALRKALS